MKGTFGKPQNKGNEIRFRSLDGIYYMATRKKTKENIVILLPTVFLMNDEDKLSTLNPEAWNPSRKENLNSMEVAAHNYWAAIRLNRLASNHPLTSFDPHVHAPPVDDYCSIAGHFNVPKL